VTDLLFDCPLHFVGFALNLIFGAFFHSDSPSGKVEAIR
jgi:hypothetical protein